MENNEDQFDETSEASQEEAPKPSRYVVSKAVAEAEFTRWAEAMGLMAKFDPELLSNEEVKDLVSTKRPVIAAIMEGHLVVNSKGQFVFTPYEVEGDAKIGKVTFKEPMLEYLRDATKEENKVESQSVLMARMTGKPQSQLLKLHNRNTSVMNAIVGLFLG